MHMYNVHNPGINAAQAAAVAAHQQHSQQQPNFAPNYHTVGFVLPPGHAAPNAGMMHPQAAMMSSQASSMPTVQGANQPVTSMAAAGGVMPPPNYQYIHHQPTVQGMT